MKIRIIATPTGEAPEHIRQAWVGLELPVKNGGSKAHVSGVLPGPRLSLKRLVVYLAVLVGVAPLLLPNPNSMTDGSQYPHLIGFLIVLWLIFRIRIYVKGLAGIRPASGYPVSASKAVKILAGHRPDAAQWWRKNRPHLLHFGCTFLFNVEACKPIDETRTLS